MASRIVIVGAGISGLSLAYRLQERLPDAHITVLERGERPGGTTWTLREQGFQVETGPNGFLDTKPSTLALCKEIGLGDQLVEASEAAGKNRYLFLGHGLKRLPDGVGAFLSSDLLSWRGKLSLLCERFRSKGDGRDESIDAFARRRAGNEAAEVFADALVTGIYAGDPRLLSLPACFPRIAELEREYGSLLRGFANAAKLRRAAAKAQGVPYQRPGKMWSLPGGLRVLIETLTAKLKNAPIHGVDVRAILLTPHGSAGKDEPTWRVHCENQREWPADVIVLTCPAYHQATILHNVDTELAREISTIAYNRVAVVAFGFRRADVPMSLDGFGYIAPENTRRDLLGVQWCSSIYPNRSPSDCVLLRAMAGGWNRPDIVDWDDTRLVHALRNELRLAMAITAEPVYHKIVRWEKAIPQYHVGHLDRVARIEDRVKRYPGLWLGGNAYHGVALNDCAEQAEAVAARVVAYLRSNSQSRAFASNATMPLPNARALAFLRTSEFQRLARSPFVDCSRLAHELQIASGHVGGQINISPAQGQDLVIHISRGKQQRSRYHVVYTDGHWVFDPRRSNAPISRTAYESEIVELNGPTVALSFVAARSNHED